MAYREIVIDETFLKKKSKPVEKFDEDLVEFLEDLKETMRKAEGIGIAAPQVGILKRVVVIEFNGLLLELINPVITHMEGSCEDREGCLSVPNIRGVVKRPERVTVEAFDRTGSKYTFSAEGYFARCICHEVDHLDGILFTHKMIREVTQEELDELKRKREKEAEKDSKTRKIK